MFGAAGTNINALSLVVDFESDFFSHSTQIKMTLPIWIDYDEAEGSYCKLMCLANACCTCSCF